MAFTGNFMCTSFKVELMKVYMTLQMILDFGADKSSSAGDFVVVMPTADSSSAIIRIA